eukprot:s36_g45.t1
MAARVPSSHGSLDGGGEGTVEVGPDVRDERVGRSDDEVDGFDSEEFREWLQERNSRRREGGDRPRRDRRGRRGEDESEEDRGSGSKGIGGGLPPEWDSSSNFQDWAIKARLWLATTRAKGHTQGPLMLQRLTGQAFQSFKHWAKDADWLQDPRGGHRLLAAMDTPEFFGEGTEEELLGSLAKLTYHLKRNKDEPCRQFFTRWDDAVRKIGEHRVTLPDKFLGFLLINSLGLGDQDIKSLMAFSRGSILVKDVKEWCRKHEMKLQARDVGVERKGTTKTYQTFATNIEPEDEDELRAMEEIYRELQPEDLVGEESEHATEDFEDVLEEHEAKEILNTLVTQKKRTFMQSLKTKRAKALARGYGQWKDKGAGASTRSQSSMGTSGYVKGGYYRMTLSEAKAKSKCSKCGQVGHWHRDPECPRNQGKPTSSASKEVNLVEFEQVSKTDEAIFCGHLEPVDSATPSTDAIFLSGTEVGPNKSLETSNKCVQSIEQDEPVNFCQGYKDRDGIDCDGSVSSGGSVEAVVSRNEFPIFWSETNRKSSLPQSINPDELCATIDTGCQRMAIGLNTLQKLDQALPQGLHTQLIKQEHKFRSVHGTSTTKYAAVIPTSLGNKGSLLRPAIFDNPESRDAPFVISLPFLMYCRAVLNLDPSHGLSMDLKRFGCSVQCHLGPSGALRVPLGQFSENMLEQIRKAQSEFQNQNEEFEVLRTTQVFVQNLDSDRSSSPNSDVSEDASNICHGRPRCHQEVTSDHQPERRADDGMAEACDEGDFHHGPDDRHDGEVGRTGQASSAVLRLSSSSRSTSCGDSVGDCRGRGTEQLGRSIDGRFREVQEPESAPVLHDQCPESEIAGIKHGWLPDHRGDARALCHRRRPDDFGNTTIVQPRIASQGVHVPQRGTQSQPTVLEVQSASSTPMPILRMDHLPTILERSATRTSAEDSGISECVIKGECQGYVPEEYEAGNTIYVHSELSNNSDRQRGDEPMPSPPDHQAGDQRAQLPREVCRLRDSAEEGAQDIGHREQSEGIQLQGTTPHDAGGIGGVPRVPGISQVEAESEIQEGGRERLSRSPSERAVSESKETNSLNRRQRRTINQARKALETAECHWNALMSLLRTAPDQVESVGWSNLNSDNLDRAARQKYMWLLQKTEKQLKVVSELYNPNRFQDKLTKFGLCPGQAFDLKLGHDLTTTSMRQEVRRYIQEVKPGLVVISPPCTLFSLLQNLTNRNQNPEANQRFMRRLIEAKVLLRFGIEIAFEVLKYGGTFVSEHPLTSRAWMETLMQRLINHPDVQLAACDQCRHGLQGRSGLPHRKPTGFLSNNSYIIDQLGLRCDGTHDHEQVIGRDQGGLRSEQSQHYPAGLVEAILKGYKMSIGTPMAIMWADLQELRRDQDRARYVQHCLDHHPEENAVLDKFEKPILAINEASEPMEAPVDEDTPEENATTEELHQYLPREKPFSLEQLVRRAHEGLGHPGNDRLARILKDARASDKAVEIAKNLKCSVCERHAATRPARKAAPPRLLHVNEIVGVDTIYLPDYRGKRRMALNIVDWCSRFQLMIPLAGHTPAAARRAYLQWVRLFGPPERLYTDLGREFKGAFEIGAEHDATFIEPSSLEMPTQRSITERAGRNFKEVLSKTMMQVACNTHEEWLNVVDIVNMTCNRLMNKSGFSPIQRVLGYTPKVPGGLMTGGSNDLATISLRGGDLQVQRAEEIRLAAAKAFHEADANQSLKNALHAGHRPVRDFEVGQLVYFWRKGTDGPKKNRPSFWRGPGRVVLTSPPSTIWISYRGFIVKAAPEQLRLASEEERFTLTGWINDLSGTREELEKQPRQGYIDLTKDPFPIEDADPEDKDIAEEDQKGPKYRLHGKTDHRQVALRDESDQQDEWILDEKQLLLHRIHRIPREAMFQPSEDWLNCPVERERIRSYRRSSGKYVYGGEDFVNEDDWIVRYGNETPCMPWTGHTTFRLHPAEVQHSGGDLRPGHPGDPTDPHHHTGLPDSGGAQDGPLRRHHEELQPSENDPEEPEFKRVRRGDIAGEESDGGYEPSIAEEEERSEEGRGEVRPHEGSEDGESSGHRPKKARTEFMEIFMTSLEKVMAAKLKKEIKFNELTREEKKKFTKAVEKEVKNNLKTQAYEILSPEESEEIRRRCPEKIIKSRFVMVEKSIDEDEVEQARKDGILIQDNGPNSTKAKARHVMKGFSEEDSENLETTTPQCGRETVLSVLQLICSRRWLPGYLDFTQAFHSGDRIQREIYAAQPHDSPLPGFSPRQLLKLLKTCYGLLDGPYAWYQHLKGVLLKLGYECSAADPCLFYLFGPDRQLDGIISVATDDLLHGGTDRHWKNMQWINENYKLGKFTKGNGRFVGKEIVCQPDGSILVHQPMYTQKIQPIGLEKERKKQKYAYCTEEEISKLRGLLGGLAWLAKETRPDLAGRVALLQQSMPHPYVQDIIEANSLAREALRHADVGLTIHPIPLEHLRVGTVTDASWANVKVDANIHSEDFWEERHDRWIRHHVQPRRLLFHPASVPGGPNVYELQDQRITIADGEEKIDNWDHRQSIKTQGEEPWCGQTMFLKKRKGEPGRSIQEKFLQHERLASQGGYITFFYDGRMETEERAFPISIVSWKSFKIKRCTVNTLSAECQAMIHGVGSIHWLRFLLQESHGGKVRLEDWEDEIGKTPCIAVTDSKSLFDTMQKCCNTSSHIDDKRTAIDVTVLKRDFQRTQGQCESLAGID